MPKETYAERGRVVRSDETPEERRDAARRRFEQATIDLKAGLQPRELIRRSPAVAVGAGIVGLLIVRRLFRRPKVITIVRNVGAPVESPRANARVERVAEKTANKSARNMIVGAVVTALVGVLRERVIAPNVEKFIAPNVERWTNDLMARFTGGQKDEKKPANGDQQRPAAATSYRA